MAKSGTDTYLQSCPLWHTLAHSVQQQRDSRRPQVRHSKISCIRYRSGGQIMCVSWSLQSIVAKLISTHCLVQLTHGGGWTHRNVSWRARLDSSLVPAAAALFCALFLLVVYIKIITSKTRLPYRFHIWVCWLMLRCVGLTPYLDMLSGVMS